MSEENKAPETQQPETYSKDFVDKVLTEKKNAMSTLAEYKQKVNTYEAQLKEAEEARLKEQNDWKTISENKAKEAQTWQEKFNGLENKLQTQVKIGAVKREFEKLGVKDGKVVEGIVPLLKLDAIKYDEATQTVIGADEEVKRIRETLPQLFAVTPSAGANHNAPQGTPSSISIDNYKAMMKDGTWNKMTKIEQQKYETELWSSLGVSRKH
jgi:hypothetical protein